MPVSKPNKPGRPFGVTLAVITSVLMFSVVPLLQVGLILLVENHFRTMDTTLILPDGQQSEGVMGGNFRGDISDERIYLQIGFALAFLVVAFFAWRGRPAFIRYLFILAVFALTALTIILTVAPALFSSQASGAVSGSSLDAFLNVLVCGQLAVSILVPLYVVWYLNRAPARAFYRGYYLQPDEPPSPGNQP